MKKLLLGLCVIVFACTGCADEFVCEPEVEDCTFLCDEDDVECLEDLKGPEIPIAGHTYLDKDGHLRDHARVRWWDPDARTLRAAAIIPGDCELKDADGRPVDQLPADPLDADAVPTYLEQTPVFVGHYWETGEQRPLSSNAICVDYSAGKGGPLVAYRWSGEKELDATNFVAG